MKILFVKYLHVVMIDKKDDFKMSWKKVSQHAASPTFQSLRQDRMICVCTAFLCDLKCLSTKNIGNYSKNILKDSCYWSTLILIKNETYIPHPIQDLPHQLKSSSIQE